MRPTFPLYRWCQPLLQLLGPVRARRRRRPTSVLSLAGRVKCRPRGRSMSTPMVSPLHPERERETGRERSQSDNLNSDGEIRAGLPTGRRHGDADRWSCRAGGGGGGDGGGGGGGGGGGEWQGHSSLAALSTVHPASEEEIKTMTSRPE